MAAEQTAADADTHREKSDKEELIAGGSRSRRRTMGPELTRTRSYGDRLFGSDGKSGG